jgi:hypothetical protein
MPWIILHANGEELSRHELVKPIVIGRATDCDIAIKDIMLSRSHCRLEPVPQSNGNGNGNGARWQLVDLGSRNGTLVGWDPVTTHVLREGDHVRMGRTRMVYFAGQFVPATHGKKPPDPDRVVRPSDPHEALSGTVTDFVFVEEEENSDDTPAAAAHDDNGMPSPQPRPNDPESYRSPTVESFLSDLASSVYVRERDSEREETTATATAEPSPEATVEREVKKPRVRAKALPKVVSTKPVYRELPRRHKLETDLSLQADEKSLKALEAPPLKYPQAQRSRQMLYVAAIVFAAAVATLIVVMSLWVLIGIS